MNRETLEKNYTAKFKEHEDIEVRLKESNLHSVPSKLT